MENLNNSSFIQMWIRYHPNFNTNDLKIVELYNELSNQQEEIHNIKLSLLCVIVAIIILAILLI
jgi:hypothetical protein